MNGEPTKLAISAHLGRVAPLFDASQQVELFDLDQGTATPTGTVTMPGPTPQQRAAALHEQGVSTLICGAISGYVHQVLAAAGIQVIPWICGPVGAVLNAYLTNTLAGPAWMAPGRGRGGFGRGLRRRRGRPWGSGFGWPYGPMS